MNRDSVVKTLKTLAKTYTIKFSVRLTESVFGLTSVFRFTATEGNKEEFGDRIPAVFFLQVSKSSVEFVVFGDARLLKKVDNIIINVNNEL